MPHIHPSAIVSAKASVAHDVTIGPYAIIEDNVILEAGSKVSAHAQILAGTRVGEDTSIGHAAIIGGDPQSLAFDTSLPSGVVIGKANRVREHVTIHRSMYEGKNTMVGNRNFFMAGCHLGHDVNMGDDNVIANNVLFAGHVEIGSKTFVGGASVFHQFIRVGDLAMIQGSSAFSMDIPPFTIGANANTVAGLNVVGMKRAGIGSEERLEIKRAFDLLYRSGKNFTQALESATEQSWGAQAQRLLTFVSQRGKKGVCPLV